MSIDSVVLSEDRQLELNRIAQSRFACRICLPRQPDSDAGRGSVLNDQAPVVDHGADDQPVETALPCFGDGWPGYESFRRVGFRVDSEAASPDSLNYLQEADLSTSA